MSFLPKGSLSSISGAGPLSDTVTSLRLGSKGTSQLFSWALSWLEDRRWTFMAWTVSSTHFKTWQEAKHSICRSTTKQDIPECINQTVREINFKRQEWDRKDALALTPKAPTKPLLFPVLRLSDYSFITKLFMRRILPKQRKSEAAQLSNW